MRSSSKQTTRRLPLLFALFLFALALSSAPATVSAATYTVTKTDDDNSVGTLRRAINDANASPGLDRIEFNLSCSGLCAFVFTIRPQSALPTITSPIEIAGYSQPGANPNTNATGGLDSIVRIAIDGSDAGGQGLRLEAGSNGSSIKGLAIYDFSTAIRIMGSSNHIIAGNYLGTLATGTNVGNSSQTYGVSILSGSNNNRIGGTLAADRNLISGCTTTETSAGIYIQEGSTGNTVYGNLIGTKKNGTEALGNRSGIEISGNNNTVGAATPEARNIISGNNFYGLELTGGASNNVVSGNYIGTDATGAAPLGNTVDGLIIAYASSGNQIGGNGSAYGNVISGNGRYGLWMSGLPGSSPTNNKVQGNRIGTNAAGDAPLPNDHGLVILYGSENLIGGIAAEGNIISGNAGNGISLASDTTIQNTVRGNFIGTNSSAANLGNALHGVWISGGASNNVIGFAGFGNSPRNVIAFNGQDGVSVTSGGTSSVGNSILGNSIHSNGGLGIDLANNGITANDTGDADNGANTLQNFPILTRFQHDSATSTTYWSATLNSTPNIQFNIQIFYSPTCDASGNGEGRTFFMEFPATTSANGNASLVISTSADIPVGQYATATATDPSGNTSEFSPCFLTTATQPGAIQFSSANSMHNEAVGTATISVTRDGLAAGATVQYSTSNGTATAGADYTAAQGTLTFATGQQSASFTIPINDDSLDEANETINLTLSNPTGGATLGAQSTATFTIIDNDQPQTSTIGLTQSNYNVAEGAQFVTINVNRTDNLSQAATVKYATSDTAGLTACTVFQGKASERCDYATSLGTLRWAAGEGGTKSFTIPIVDDAHVEGVETFNIALSSPTGGNLGAQTTALVNISDNANDSANAPNPIDDISFFVTQQYIDFLGRLPDQGGFNNWVATLQGCPDGGYGLNNPTCDRVHVAKSTFQSIEFQTRGYWAYRFYEVAFGRRPSYSEFIPDMALVGGPKSPQEEALSKDQHLAEFIQRSEFTQKYDSVINNAAAYVDLLLQTAGLPNHPQRATLISQMQSGQKSAAQVLREIVESQEVEDRFYVRGFVSMMYYGFLRRDPDAAGFQNYVNQLNTTWDPRKVTFDFIYSPEYLGRFGKP
jgi:hypothetical protein